MRSLSELCAGLREHYASFDGAWASDDCAIGPRRQTRGAFAEVLLMGVHAGHDRPAGDARVERTMLGATLHDPVVDDFAAHVLLAARIGEAWFPLHLFEPLIRAGDVTPEQFTWQLDEDGARIEWTDQEGSGSRADHDGYGRVERTLAVVSAGIPLIAAQATVERWRSEVELSCARDCNTAPNPPPYPGCQERCASRAAATRTWERSGDTLRIGASVAERSGPRADDIELTVEEARTVRLDHPDPNMGFCAFIPVVHARPREAPRTDPESVALLAHARTLAASHAGHDVAGARAAADLEAPHSIVAIDAQLGGGCGGGGCTIAVRHRTLEGLFPEQGVHFFQRERGTQAGCDPAVLPEGSAPTLLEVAPARADASLGCGFSGWDGSDERTWVVLRVLE